MAISRGRELYGFCNRLGESDYGDGFPADIEILEYRYLSSLFPFGNTEEIMLKTALDFIFGVSGKGVESRKMPELNRVGQEIKFKFEDEMFILPEEMKTLRIK